MCYLVTIGTRENRAEVEALLGVGCPLALRASKNRSLRSAFPRADKLFEVTHGSCSCDLMTQHQPRSLEEQRKTLRAQYDKKGWSEAKVARALADWKTAHHRKLERRADPARELIRLLQTLAARPGGVRVVVHFYSGRFDGEEIPLVGTTSVPVERLEIGTIDEDTLTHVLPPRINS